MDLLAKLETVTVRQATIFFKFSALDEGHDPDQAESG